MENYVTKNCSGLNKADIYKAYLECFEDLIIREEIDEAEFFKKYFIHEANSLIYSYITYDKERPVALLLGGIIRYDDIKTMRCGFLGISRDYKDMQILENLLELHYKDALTKKCCMLLLEVAEGSERVNSLYKKNGYENAYFIKTYIFKGPRNWVEKNVSNVSIEEIDISRIRKLKPILNETHMNWENDIDCISKIDSVIYYGVLDRYNISGFMAFDMTGNIFRIWTHPAHRNKGIARALISKIMDIIDSENLKVSVSSNAGISNFLRRLGFEKEDLTLIEMVKPVLW